MKILMVAAEFAPVAEVGGVAQYLSGLSQALRRCGHSVRVALPRYQFLREHLPPQTTNGFETIDVNSIPVLLFGNHPTFTETRVPGQVYRISDDFDRWVDFSRAVTEFIRKSSWKPDVVHCHDAHASLVPTLLSQDADPLVSDQSE